MAITLSQSIRSRANAYVAGNLALDEFKDWLVGATWNVERDHPDAADLVYDLKLLLAEHSNGDLPELDLRKSIDHLLSPITVLS